MKEFKFAGVTDMENAWLNVTIKSIAKHYGRGLITMREARYEITRKIQERFGWSEITFNTVTNITDNDIKMAGRWVA